MSQDLSRSTLLGSDTVAEEDLEAYRANYETHRIGISGKECIESYNRNADNYEQNLSPSRYRGYVIAAEMVEKYKNNEKSVRVVDVGAGTGFLGRELKKRGYNNIDCLEPASEMLQLAMKKNVYKNLYCDILGGTQVRIPDDTYDVLALSGSMGEGHIPCKGLTEMIRIVKPGGLVVIVMRQEYLEYVMEYKDRLVPYMKELEGNGKWQCLEETMVPNYAFGKDGVAFVYQVLESGFLPMTSKVI